MEVVYTFTNLEPCINHLLYVLGVTEFAIGITFYYVQKSNRPKGEDKYSPRIGNFMEKNQPVELSNKLQLRHVVFFLILFFGSKNNFSMGRVFLVYLLRII